MTDDPSTPSAQYAARFRGGIEACELYTCGAGAARDAGRDQPARLDTRGLAAGPAFLAPRTRHRAHAQRCDLLPRRSRRTRSDRLRCATAARKAGSENAAAQGTADIRNSLAGSAPREVPRVQ